jgi:uncharacterized membrane protein
MKNFLQMCTPYAGRIICTILGIICAIIWLLIGFWRMLLLAILAALGYLLGLAIDDKEKFAAIIRKIKLVLVRE